jgi:hypothetical protein
VVSFIACADGSWYDRGDYCCGIEMVAVVMVAVLLFSIYFVIGDDCE